MSRIAHQALSALCNAILISGGVDKAQAHEITRNLVWSEMVGRENFGLLRLPVYLERVARGGLTCPCNPSFADISPSASLLDADNGFGQYAARLAMDRAVSLARVSGVGTVGVRNSNFFGTGAYFVHQAARDGMIAMVMSNSFPKVTAHGGVAPVLGTNPLAFGAPRRNGDSLMFDMATSALAGSTVREHIERGSLLPEGLAIDADGVAITDPSKVDEGSLLPAAGAKGYGLSLLVEILAGVLTGAGVSGDVASMYKDLSKPGSNGHFMITLDVSRFMTMEQFYDRLEGLVTVLKASNPGNEVLFPGEIRWRNHKANSELGIALPDATRKAVETACERTGVACPWSRALQTA